MFVFLKDVDRTLQHTNYRERDFLLRLRLRQKTPYAAVYKSGIQELAFYYHPHSIIFSLFKIFDSSSLPYNVFISTLVGTRLHTGCRQESHLLTANYPQLMFKFTFILSIKKMYGNL